MHKFSRWMPPSSDSKPGLLVWLIVAAVLLFVAYCLWKEPLLTCVIVVVIFGYSLIRKIHHQCHFRDLAVGREGEDIGTFARRFDRRQDPFDPWVVRAVWEELQECVTFGERDFPIRPDDELCSDLLLDAEGELLEIVGEAVAQRTHHTLDGIENNPFLPIVTVRDLVRCLSAQPLTVGSPRSASA